MNNCLLDLLKCLLDLLEKERQASTEYEVATRWEKESRKKLEEYVSYFDLHGGEPGKLKEQYTIDWEECKKIEEEKSVDWLTIRKEIKQYLTFIRCIDL